MKGTVIKPAGTAAIAITPSNLLGSTRNKLNVGKKYHSGKISKGVANGSAFSPNADGSRSGVSHVLWNSWETVGVNLDLSLSNDQQFLQGASDVVSNGLLDNLLRFRCWG